MHSGVACIGILKRGVRPGRLYPRALRTYSSLAIRTTARASNVNHPLRMDRRFIAGRFTTLILIGATVTVDWIRTIEPRWIYLANQIEGATK